MPSDPNPAVFVDATLFMGMHSRDQAVRIGCKAFFADRLAAGEAGRVLMSWEQVGRCDDLVWGCDRHTQDEYYPFMDVLHTDLTIDRVPYDEDDVRRAFTAPELEGLPAHERLLLAQVIGRGGTLHTASPRLVKAAAGLPVVAVGPRAASEAATPLPEPAFPAYLEDLYQRSLVLTVVSENL
ncbi:MULTISPECIES: DUF6190 family protein [unclassified Streptomyces]|uniref:DUF6190 family protein n=1 Tax=unclassified Streptomyces TaxID=2593676 RepID=UPI0016606FC3|nr:MULTISPECIES: DUF6190 family protein [unclassified Streptomyces]MBD0712161.1 hypothetical protein [Streptomyces sp. CBMA291]MBD0713993.1 hypothetical protein [Streptomyces sp. CBMA370]